MKYRIQILEKQASDYYWSLEDGVRTADAFTEKFAELIIEECHQVCIVGGVDDLDGLKKHFEIE